MSRTTIGLFIAGLVVGGAVVAAALTGGGDSGSPWAGSTPSQSQPLIVALCHGENQTWPESLDQSYFEALFTETDGSTTIADYWRDVSHGEFSIEGTRVLDVQLDIPRDDIGDRDDDDFGKCRDGVDDQYDVDWSVFAGPVVIKPQTTGATVNAIDENDTEVQVRTASPSVMDDWPSPPFTLVLTKNNSLWRKADKNIENVRVTAVSKDYDTGVITFTIEREQEGYRGGTPPAKSFPSGTVVRDIYDTYGTRNRTAVVPVYASPSTINQELGHFFGFAHSRKLSTAGGPYKHCFDIMSTITCTSHYFKAPAEGQGVSLEQYNGPGMTSIFLDQKGWIAGADRRVFCREESTYSVRALGIEGSGPQQIRVPAEIEIRKGVMSNYIAVELRSQQFAWDQGIPRDAFVLSLKGDDGIPYLIDDPGAGGTKGMVAGDTYTFVGDPDNQFDDRVFIVDAIDEGSGTGEITVRNPTWDPALDDCGSIVGGGTGASTTSTTEPGDTTTTTAEDSTTTTDSDRTGAACLVDDTWLLDSQAFLDEVVRIGAESGAPIPGEVRHEGGAYTLTIADDGDTTMVRDDWSFSVSTAQGTFYVTLDGVQRGTSSYDDTTIEYSEESSTVEVKLEMESGGVRQVIPGGDQPVDTDPLGGSGTYECVGDTLTIVVDNGGVVTVWTRTTG